MEGVEGLEGRAQGCLGRSGHSDIATGLTPFQERAEGALVAALRASGIELERRLLRGDEERFIEAAFQNGVWTTWIYEDGAEARSTDGTEVRLEKGDARTPEELIERYVDGVISGLR